MERENITNILFVDKKTENYQVFVDSVNDSTFPIIYNQDNSRSEIESILIENKFKKINRIGFVFHEDPIYTFLENQPLFLDNETAPFSENVQFILNIIQTYKVENIDYLACNTLNYKNWVDYYSIIETNTNAIVGGSNSNTGNPEYGGDWIMESTNTDVKNLYFTENIESYTFLLNGCPFTINSFVLTTNGTIYGCGYNSNSQLGNGGSSNSTTTLTQMTSVPNGKTPSAIIGGGSSLSNFYTIVLMTDGTIYCCGINSYGQFGNGGNSNSTTLTQMTPVAGKTPSAISCGADFFTIVLMTDGTIYGCGANSNGQLGNNGTNTSLILTPMNPVTGKTPSAISCGTKNTIVLMTDGSIYGCGSNSDGQLGNNGTNTSLILTPMNPVTGKTPSAISCGTKNTIVLMTDGTIYGCGANGSGQLGNSSYTGSKVLTPMNPVTGKTPSAISCGENNTIVLMTDGTIYGCGNNNYGQLGNSSYIPSTLTPMILSGLQTGVKPSAISGGNNFTIVLMTDGSVYGCGANNNGQIGNNTTSSGYNRLTQMITTSPNPIPTGVKVYGLFGTNQYSPITNPQYTFLSFTSYLGLSFTNGNIIFTITLPSTTTPTIYTYAANISSITTTNIDPSLTKLSIGTNVTSIGASAFNGCVALTSITIPNSITSVGTNAFAGISTGVTIIGGAANTTIPPYMFNGNTTMNSITINTNITGIGASAFSGYTTVTSPTSACTALPSITIPSSITFIGASAFDGCSALTSITIPNSITNNVGANAFAGISTTNNSVIIIGGASGTTIPPYMFNGNTTMNSITINPTNNNITAIGASAFSGYTTGTITFACTALPSITIPSGITSIGDSAFKGCVALTSITIPNTITSVTATAFAGVTSVTINGSETSTTIPSSMFSGVTSLGTLAITGTNITAIGASAFNGCSALANINLPTNTITIAASSNVFKSIANSITISGPTSGTTATAIPANMLNGNTTTTSLTIGGTLINSIGASAFNGCSALANINLPTNAITIAESSNVFKSIANSITISGPTSGTTATAIPANMLNGNTTTTSLTIRGTLINSIGASAFNGCSALTSITIPTSITGNVGASAFAGISSSTKSVTITASDTNTTIPPYMFNGNTTMTSITINPTNNNITAIGASAFSGYPGTSGTVVGCTALPSITIPSGITSIGAFAFQNCSALTSITTPISLNTITVGESAFAGISNSTKSVTIIGGAANTIIPPSMFNGNTTMNSIIISTNITGIGASAFQNCSALTSITIPTSISGNVGASAFAGISNTSKSVTITASVTGTIIPPYMFNGNTTMTSITISTNITGIGASAFSGYTTGTITFACRALPSITIPSGITSIGASAFNGCTALSSITTPISLNTITIPGSAFANISTSVTIIGGAASTIIPPSMFNGNTNMNSIIISTNITGIGASAFQNCLGLTSITIPTSLNTSSIGASAFAGISDTTKSVTIIGGASGTTIPPYMFNGNTTMNSITINPTNNNITAIGASAFSGYTTGTITFACTALPSITIPSGITSIGASAFNGCSALNSITTPTSLNTITILGSAFANISTSVTIIGGAASTIIPPSMFNGNTTMNSIIISNSNNYITGIGASAFQNCSGLTSITIPTSITGNVGASAFAGISNTTKSVTITASDTNTTIPPYMFNGNTTMTSITVSSSNITGIGASAFSGYTSSGTVVGCTSLSQVYFSNSVSTISSSAFQNCTSLSSINLVNTTSVNSNAFNGCTNLLSVVSYATSNIFASGATTVFPTKTATSTIYTNFPTAANNETYKSYFTFIIINQSLPNPKSAILPYSTPGNPTSSGGTTNQSIDNVISLNGVSSPSNLLYGIPQSSSPNSLNYYKPEILQKNSFCTQYNIYNTSGTPQYFQFLPYCNGKSSSGSTGGSSVANIYSISNNICTLQNNCVVSFSYVSNINFNSPNSTTDEGYVTLYASKLS